MNLYKTTFFSGIETAIKLASGFVVMKYVAMQLGPAGVAYFGQFQNFMASFIILIAGGFPVGLVRFSAKEKPHSQSNKHYLGNALGFGLVSSIIVGICTCFFAPYLSLSIFKSGDFSGIFYLLAVCGVLIMFYQVLISMFNGWGELMKFLTCKSTASVLLLFFSLLLVKFYALVGGLISLVSMQSMAAFLALWFITKMPAFKWQWLKPRFDISVYKTFLPYWLMSFVTLISTPFILMLIRTHIVNEGGWEMAGLWEAAWKITELYLLVITTALTTYYVPKLSQALALKQELLIIREVLFFSVGFASFLSLMLYLLRHQVISVLFSNHFVFAADMMAFQLIGGVIKIASWVMSYHMLVKDKMKVFLFSELFFGGSFYIISKCFFDQYGLVGLSYAYFFNYSLYFLFCSLYMFQYFTLGKFNKFLFIKDDLGARENK